MMMMLPITLHDSIKPAYLVPVELPNNDVKMPNDKQMPSNDTNDVKILNMTSSNRIIKNHKSLQIIKNLNMTPSSNRNPKPLS